MVVQIVDALVSGANNTPATETSRIIDQTLKTQDGLLPVVHGAMEDLPEAVRAFVEAKANLCKPDNVHIVDGTERENNNLINTMQKMGMIERLEQLDNCFLARTDPADVARVESKTVICTPNKRDTVPIIKDGVKGTLGNWISPEDLDKAVQERFPGCMKGRTMYVIPFSMGPLGSPMSKIGIELTDSPYVVASMRIMTRMGKKVLDLLGDGDFIKCLHSVGAPLPLTRKLTNNWPCNPEQVLVAHKPLNNEILSFGSGYGGNSLLGKKCFALRIGSTIARREGWLAEHMLILGITNPAGKKRYIAAAFPSACGKTNLAMMTPTLPGYKIECVGDDIAWMKFDSEGRLRAINPENGFFGVAPGTNRKSNPCAMDTVMKDTVFTNVAKTAEGGVYWEGLEKEVKSEEITSWLGEKWTPESKKPSAHPNSRFCTPAKNCPIMDPAWEDPAGVPIDAILFGGRRPEGVPLVYEAFNWKHGVLIGAAMKSEATAAAEHKGKMIMHDPFAMRPFFGYNTGHYFSHWLSMEERQGAQLPKIFHVNWFRKNTEGKFIWPGFGENCRVLDWILQRVENKPDTAVPSPVGYLPNQSALNLEGLSEPVDLEQAFNLPKQFWLDEVAELEQYFSDQLGNDFPNELCDQLEGLKERIQDMDA